jgi:hypothetical protein
MSLPYLKKTCKNEQSGQALILILLALSAVLVVTLSVSSRTVSDISTTNYEESSLRAFSAAEAGVEKMLLQNNPVSAISDNLTDNNSKYNAYPRYVQLTSKDYKFPSELKAGENAVLWFVEHDANNNLACSGSSPHTNCYSGNKINNLAWGIYDPATYNNTNTPAIEVTIYYDSSCTTFANCKAIGVNHDYSAVKIKRMTYDPIKTSRSPANNFNEGKVQDTKVAGTKFHYRLLPSDKISFADISCNGVDGCLLLMTIRMLYNDRPEGIAVDNFSGSAKSFPSQGVMIDSVGESGDTVRRLNVLKTYALPPAFVDAAVFANQNIIKDILP